MEKKEGRGMKEVIIHIPELEGRTPEEKKAFVEKCNNSRLTIRNDAPLRTTAEQLGVRGRGKIGPDGKVTDFTMDCVSLINTIPDHQLLPTNILAHYMNQRAQLLTEFVEVCGPPERFEVWCAKLVASRKKAKATMLANKIVDEFCGPVQSLQEILRTMSVGTFMNIDSYSELDNKENK